MGLTGCVLEQWSATPQLDAQRHHQLFPYRIHRRIGDLGEHLVEVLGESSRSLREHRETRVVSHRPDRGNPECHVGKYQPSLFCRVAEDTTEGSGIESIVGQPIEGSCDVKCLGGHPFVVGLECGKCGFDLGRVPDLSRAAVKDDHLSGPELAGFEGTNLFLRTHTRFRRHQDHVGGDRPTCRAETVAVHPGK